MPAQEHHPDDIAILGTPLEAALQPGDLRLADLLVREALLDRLVELVLGGGHQLVVVARVVDRVHGELAGAALHHVGAHEAAGAVAESLLLAQPLAQPGAQRTLGEDVGADAQRDPLRVAALEVDRLNGHVHRHLLVGGLELDIGRVDFPGPLRNPDVLLAAGPVGQLIGEHLFDGGKVEITGHGDVGTAGAIQAGVKGLDLVEGRGLVRRHRFVERGLVERMLRAVHLHGPVGGDERLCLRLGALLFDLDDVLLLELVELVCREARSLEGFEDQLERRHEVLPAGLDRRARRVRADAGKADARLELVERILEVGPGLGGRSALQHARGQVGNRGLPRQGLLGAVAQLDREVHGVAARLLGKEVQLGAVGQRHVREPGVDPGRRDIERLSGGARFGADVRRDDRREVGGLGDFRPLGGCRRVEHAEGAVARHQVRLGDALHVGGRDALEAVAMNEQESPVGHARPFAQLDADILALVEGQLDLLEELRLRTVHLLGGHRRARELLERRGEREAGIVEAAVLRHLGEGGDQSRLGQGPGECAGTGGELGVDERLVLAAADVGTEDFAEDGDGREVGMRAGDGVVRQHDQLHVADAPQHGDALAVLRRLLGVRLVQQHSVAERPHRARNAAELVLDELERPGVVEPAGDDEHGVVGLVVLAVEDLQPVGGNALDVGLVADRVLAVVVPLVGGGHRLLQQHAEGGVLPGLELVTDDRELLAEVLLPDERVHEPVGLEVERPVEVRVRARHNFEVVRAVVPSAAVPLRAAVVEFLRNIQVARRPLEDHVLDQVRHAGLAVALVPRPDHHGQVHRDRGLGRVGDEQDLEPVGQRVFGDPLDRGNPAGSGRRGSGRGCGSGALTRCGRRERDGRERGGGGESNEARAHMHWVSRGRVRLGAANAGALASPRQAP